MELRGLPRVNAADGYAARSLQRAAVRLGGTACRYGGARLALLVRGADAAGARNAVADALSDMPSQADAHVTAAGWQDGESGAEVVDRARAALRGAGAAPSCRTQPGCSARVGGRWAACG